jgi:hypothetical protein
MILFKLVDSGRLIFYLHNLIIIRKIYNNYKYQANLPPILKKYILLYNKLLLEKERAAIGSQPYSQSAFSTQ